jgi:restriction endonuclease S subunit
MKMTSATAQPVARWPNMMAPLGTVADVSTGYPFRTKVETEDGGDIHLIQMKDLEGAEGIAGVTAVVLRSNGGKYDRYLLKAGDLLFQSRGSRHPVAIVEPGIRGIAPAGLHVIRPHVGRVLPKYLAWWLNHPTSQAKIKDDLARGSYIPFVSKRDLEDFAVSVPSLAIQRRITEVDELRRKKQWLSARLAALTQELVDGVTMATAMNKHLRNK